MIVARPGGCAPCRAQAVAAWSGGELLEELALATGEKATGVRTSGAGGGNSLTGDLLTQRTAGDKAAEVAPGLSPHLFGV